VFVKSEENIADGFIKNIMGNLYDSHVKEFMAEQEYLKSQEDHSMPRKGVTKYATK
jgi:hypothetical protein